jgi:hypothetical protein
MTEKEIQLLGFEKKHTRAGDVMSSYYYELDGGYGGLKFVTPSNVNVKNGDKNDWWINIYETKIKYFDFEEAQALLNSLERHLSV